MSLLVFSESFELFPKREDVSFGAFLVESGYAVTGAPAYAPGRDGQSVAADLSQGGFRATVTSQDAVTAFGFAALASEACRALVVSGELTLDLGVDAYVSGFAAPKQTQLGRWLYYELVVDKLRREVDLYINDQFQAAYPMPPALRFQSAFELFFPAAPGLLVDDIGVSVSGRTGPIAARAFDVNTPLPRNLFLAGQNAQGALTPAAELPDQPLAVRLSGEASVSDLDARETVFYAGANERSISLGVSPRAETVLFNRAPDNTPWSLNQLRDTLFGVRITR